MKKAFQDSIQEALKKGWADFTSTLTDMEGEVQKQYKKVVDKVDPQQAKTEIQETLTDMGRRIQETGEELERTVEDRVLTVITRLKDPIMEELDNLRKQAESIGSRIESQVRRNKDNGDGADEDEGQDPGSSA